MIAERAIESPEGRAIEQGKWPTLLLLALAEMLGMAVYLSASAVVPALTTAWSLDDSGRAWLTISVQLGFVIGALASALSNLGDRLPARWLFTGSALFAALTTALIPAIANGLPAALFLRILTGIGLAGVYPVGMKIMATWTRKDRGLGIGLLVGALTVGQALPHLIRAFGDINQWQVVLYGSAGMGALGGLLAAMFVEEGPYRAASVPFNWKYVAEVARDRDMLLANLGYLGHMWELFAMWAWVPVFLMTSFDRRGVTPMWASLASFAVLAAGGVGSLLAGKLADVAGRTLTTILSMGISGTCALLAGRLFGGDPILLVILCLIWGFAVVADSAQFSACISELCDPTYTATALTVQTSLGFLLTIVTLRLMPTLAGWVGWEWAFMALAIGPAAGIWAMAALRKSPGAARLAGGRR